jgi:hypothetical protein
MAKRAVDGAGFLPEVATHSGREPGLHLLSNKRLAWTPSGWPADRTSHALTKIDRRQRPERLTQTEAELNHSKETAMARAAKSTTVDYHSHRTRDRETIRRWAERRGGRPAMVEGTQILRVDFDTRTEATTSTCGR